MFRRAPIEVPLLSRMLRETPRALWWILASSTALKLLLIWPAADLEPMGDQLEYLTAARSLVEKGVVDYFNPSWDEAHAPPVMTYFLAASYRIAGEEGYRQLARFVQVLLSAVTVLLVYGICARFLSRRTALLTTGLVAFYPNLVAFSHYFWSETIYIFLLVAVVALLLRGSDSPSGGWLLAAGLVSGVASLTRSIFVLQLPLLVLWLLGCSRADPRRRLVLASLFLAGVCAVVLPWSVRNTLRYDRFLLIDTNAGNVIYKNLNSIGPESHDLGMNVRRIELRNSVRKQIPPRPRVEFENIVDRNNAEIRAGLEYVLEHPAHYLRQTRLRLLYFSNPSSFLIRHLRRHFYGDLPPLVTEPLVLLAMGSAMFVMAFSLVGLVMGPWSRERLLLALLALGHALVHVLLIATSRYRLPLVPLLAPFATDALVRFRELLDLARYGRRWLLLAPALALLILAWASTLPASLPWLAVGS